MPPSPSHPSAASSDPARPEPDDAREPSEAGAWPSETLLRGRQVVCIDHKGVTYQLRLTRQDKLILTK